jgi:hypothetical protein
MGLLNRGLERRIKWDEENCGETHTVTSSKALQESAAQSKIEISASSFCGIPKTANCWEIPE